MTSLSKAAQLEKDLGFSLPPEIHEFQPIGNRILVRRSERETETEGGIVIPDNAQQPPAEGVIVKIGHLVSTGVNSEQGYCDLPYVPEALVGMHIVFGQFAGTCIKFHSWDETYGGEFLLMQSRDIWGFNSKGEEQCT